MLKIHDFLHTSYAEELIKKDMLNTLTKYFDNMNTTIDSFVDPEKIANRIGQIDKSLSCDDFVPENEQERISKQIATIAEETGWKNFMEGATEFIQKVKTGNCVYIIDAIRESGDRSVEKGLLKLASNESNHITIRTQSIYALSRTGDASTIEKLENLGLGQKKLSPSIGLAIKYTCRHINKKLQSDSE